MTEREFIAAAKTLLADPFWLQLEATMRDEAITKFESSEPNDDATRREAFYEAAAFKRIRRKLENRIAKFDYEPTTPRNP